MQLNLTLLNNVKSKWKILCTSQNVQTLPQNLFYFPLRTHIITLHVNIVEVDCIENTQIIKEN